MEWIVQLSMNYRVLLLVFLLCMVAVPALAVSGNYMGGDIVLGGSGPKQITQVSLVITESTTPPVPPAALSSTGSLSVATSPAGAVIFVDGVQRGVSPATIPGLTPGSHTLLVTMNGYADLTVPVTIRAGQTQAYTTALAPVAAAATATPVPPQKKTPGFEAFAGLAALAAVLVKKGSR
jgi:hypothetical protein